MFQIEFLSILSQNWNDTVINNSPPSGRKVPFSLKYYCTTNCLPRSWSEWEQGKFVICCWLHYLWGCSSFNNKFLTTNMPILLLWSVQSTFVRKQNPFWFCNLMFCFSPNLFVSWSLGFPSISVKIGFCRETATHASTTKLIFMSPQKPSPPTHETLPFSKSSVPSLLLWWN